MAPISPGRAAVSGAGRPSPAARNASNVETALPAKRPGRAAGASPPTIASRPGAGPSTPSNACSEARLGHHHRRRGVLDLVRQERAPELGIDRHDDGAGLHRAEEGDQDFGPVAEQRHHPLAGADPGSGERRREAVRLPVEAGEGQRRSALEGREDPLAVLARTGADQMRHRPVRPDAAVAQNRFPAHGR